MESAAIQPVSPSLPASAEADSFTGAVIEQFIRESDVAALTAKSYRTACSTLVKFLREKHVELNEDSLILYREFLKATRAASSGRLYFCICKQFTKWLAKRGYIRCDFGDGVKNVRLDASQHSRDSLTLAESREVLRSFAGKHNLKALRDKAVMAIMICCGLRTIEVVRLDVGDIERRRGQWTMRVHGKGRAGKVDSVILPAEVKALIDEYLKARGKVSAGEPLFVSTSKRNKNCRLQTQTISRLAKAVFRSVGIESKRITAHSCRHSCATLALSAGCDLDSVSKNLRHKSISTTEIYRHDDRLFTNRTTQTVSDLIFGGDSIGTQRENHDKL